MQISTIGAGPVECVLLSAVGIPWIEAVWPPDLADVLTTHVVVPSAEADTIAAAADELLGVAGDLSWPPLLCGISMNGTVALAAAARRPDAVRGVVAITSPPCLPVDPAAVERYPVPAERAAEFARRKAAAEAASAAASDPGSPEVMALWWHADAVRRWHDLDFDSAPLNALVTGVPGWVPALMADGATYDWAGCMASLGGAAVPVLLVLGASDFIVPPTAWDVEGGLPPSFTVRVLDRSGHTPCFEQPTAFVAELTAWLSTLG